MGHKGGNPLKELLWVSLGVACVLLSRNTLGHAAGPRSCAEGRATSGRGKAHALYVYIKPPHLVLPSRRLRRWPPELP